MPIFQRHSAAVRRQRRNDRRACLIRRLWQTLSPWSLSGLWKLAGLIGWLVYVFSQRERRVTQANLRVAYPQLSRREQTALTRESLRHSTATMLELGHAWMAPPEKVESGILEIQGKDILDAAGTDKSGVIVLAPHFGNWEVLNVWLSRHVRLTAMYEPPKLSALDPVIRHGRERGGTQLVPTTSRGVATLLKALKRQEAVGILPDQEPGWGSGVFVPFFNRPAYTATLLPRLVARTGARVVIGVAVRHPGRGFALHFMAADPDVYSHDDQTSAAGVNASIEAVIALAPAQYQWEYKRYRKCPDQPPIQRLY